MKYPTKIPGSVVGKFRIPDLPAGSWNIPIIKVRPNWIRRHLVKWLLGWDWVDR